MRVRKEESGREVRGLLHPLRGDAEKDSGVETAAEALGCPAS